MSTKTRTSPSAADGRDAFGPGTGLAHEFGLAMGKERVTASMLKQGVSNPLQRARLGAILRGEMIVPPTSINDLVVRELAILERMCPMLGVDLLQPKTIQRAFERSGEVFGNVTEHDRFIPGGLGLPNLFSFFYQFNDQQAAVDAPVLKLYHARNSEWWRSDKSAQPMPTEAGVFRCHLSEVMQPTDLLNRPFNLDANGHEAWAAERGGDGISSAEEALYLFARRIVEEGRPLWNGGWLRCCNAYGSGCSLGVDWNAVNGLFVGSGYREDSFWDWGALPRKSVPLNS